jgi:hypothetical protein
MARPHKSHPHRFARRRLHGVASTLLPRDGAQPSGFGAHASTEVPRPFSRQGWTFELKYDGWRCLAEIRDGDVRLQSRRGFDITRRWPAVVQSLSTMRGHHIFDGEMCVLDDYGRSDFDRLHLSESGKTYCVFDLLVHDGMEIMSERLSDRKSRLAVLIPAPLPSVLMVGTSTRKASGCTSRLWRYSLRGSSESTWTRGTSRASALVTG